MLHGILAMFLKPSMHIHYREASLWCRLYLFLYSINRVPAANNNYHGAERSQGIQAIYRMAHKHAEGNDLVTAHAR